MKSFLLMLIALIVITIVTLPVIVLSVIRKAYRRESIQDYFFIIAIGFDQAGGSILYGQEDWTVSSWTYVLAYRENKEAQRFMKIINFIFGENHCEKSYLWESIKQGDVK
jgi:hypothetical protein